MEAGIREKLIDHKARSLHYITVSCVAACHNLHVLFDSISLPFFIVSFLVHSGSIAAGFKRWIFFIDEGYVGIVVVYILVLWSLLKYCLIGNLTIFSFLATLTLPITDLWCHINLQ